MKQRLIDANDVNNHIIGWVDLRGCPTIDAIPVEWVKKFRNQFEPGDDDYNLIDGLLNIWRRENE